MAVEPGPEPEEILVELLLKVGAGFRLSPGMRVVEREQITGPDHPPMLRLVVLKTRSSSLRIGRMDCLLSYVLNPPLARSKTSPLS